MHLRAKSSGVISGSYFRVRFGIASCISSVNSRKIEKAKKIEECNIKIPYLNFVLLGAVAFVIQFVGVLIARI